MRERREEIPTLERRLKAVVVVAHVARLAQEHALVAATIVAHLTHGLRAAMPAAPRATRRTSAGWVNVRALRDVVTTVVCAGAPHKRAHAPAAPAISERMRTHWSESSACAGGGAAMSTFRLPKAEGTGRGKECPDFQKELLGRS